MKKFTLSIAAIAMISTAAVADISSKNFGGEAKLFYGTNDANDGDMFNKAQSYGNVGVHLGGAASVGSCKTCTTLNYGVTGVSTMGLEDTLVSNTWAGQSVTGARTAKNFLGGADINDGVWIDTLNLAFHPLDGITNTTLVLGRQALDTPLVFTEKWNIAENTYDAAVAVNNDIVDTTLVGAWVGRSNGQDVVDQLNSKNEFAIGGLVHSDGISDNGFNRFLTDEGAYTVGAITKAIPMLTAQAWYYVAPSVANLAWLQADTDIMGFTLGGQYVYSDPAADNSKTGGAYATKIGYNYEGLGLSVAYSDTDEDLMTASNLGGTQSKLYTEAWWDYSHVAQPDTQTVTVAAEYDLPEIAALGLYYTNADHGVETNNDFQEIALTAGKDLGNLNLTLAYVNSDLDGDIDTAGNDIDATNDVQVYATYKF